MREARRRGREAGWGKVEHGLQREHGGAGDGSEGALDAATGRRSRRRRTVKATLRARKSPHQRGSLRTRVASTG